MKYRSLHTLILGSGAAGLCTAVRLHALGVRDTAVYTEGLDKGTSINTGSDKQTYYKLGMYGTEPDSPVLMARDMIRGGSSHGDIALIEAALSPVAFSHLAALGVPFPHDRFGQYIGYKTDHDPKRRATSCGPYTSRDMCRALIRDAKLRGIEICEGKIAVKLFTDRARTRCLGALFMDPATGEREAVQAQNTVFAVGGPGGLYETSVYPEVHTGAIGLALEAGAAACNLAESQFGLASTGFRWNVSGSYMQVLPRFVSVGPDGSEREFLREYFDSPAEMYGMIFLKGYQWPFSCGHLPGSSLIDIFTHIETGERGRRVYLDFRSDPPDFDFGALPSEAKEYLVRSGATQASPLERLRKLNAPAIGLYREHEIDLEKDMLEIAVCAQHNNGGLAGDLNWQSVNMAHLYPVGEVNGSHGVTRPGGTALNAGQTGAFRAAEHIACDRTEAFDPEEFRRIAEAEEQAIRTRLAQPSGTDWRAGRRTLRKRMTASGAFIRDARRVSAALGEAKKQLAELAHCRLGGLDHASVVETLRNRQLCAAQVCYLTSILCQAEHTGSRGGALVLDPQGEMLSPHLNKAWRMKKENPEDRTRLMFCRMTGEAEAAVEWEPCRPVPEEDGWFESVWKEYRDGHPDIL